MSGLFQLDPKKTYHVRLLEPIQTTLDLQMSMPPAPPATEEDCFLCRLEKKHGSSR